MLKTALKLSLMSIFGFSLIGLSACGPQLKVETRKQVPLQEIQYENEVATPTVTIPQNNSDKKYNYQTIPKKIINNNKTEIYLGKTQLTDTKISYSSIDQKMNVIGHVIIFEETDKGVKKTLAEKDFLLTGEHKPNENSFILKDLLSNKEQSQIKIRAEARCLSLRENNDLNCNDVMVDIYFLHNNKYYTEQIEVHRIKKQSPPTDIPDLTPPPAATDPEPPNEVVQKENEDQSNSQQSEESDDSINGRYQGGAEIIDLTLLFADITPTPAPTTPPQAPPQAPPATPDKAPPSSSPPTQPSDKLPQPVEKVLSPEMVQTNTGDIRPINQANGFPDNGFLRNATSLLTRQQALADKAFFEVVSPEKKRHFGTFEMAEIITRVGEKIHRLSMSRLFLSNISALKGGKISPHASHQNGLDADIAYPTDLEDIKFPLVVRMKTQEYFPKNYSVEKTYHLLKYLFTQTDIVVDRIFIDQKIKKDLCAYAIEKGELQEKDKDIVNYMFSNLQHVEGHGDHFHLRIKCSKFDPSCRGRIYKNIDSCGI